MPNHGYNLVSMPESFAMSGHLEDLRKNRGLLVAIDVSQGGTDREIGFIFELTQDMLERYIRQSQYITNEPGVLSLQTAMTTKNCAWILPKNSKSEVTLYRPVIELFSTGCVGLSDYMPCSEMLSTRVPLRLLEEFFNEGKTLSIFQHPLCHLSTAIAEGDYKLVSPD